MGKLGDTLRERRVALGLSLEQAQEGTRIREKLLHALEEGEYDRLPNPGYVRGYISSYARFLELDPVPLLNMYKAETGVGHQHQLNLPQASQAVAPIGEQHAVPWRAAVSVVLAIALVSLAIWAVTRIWRGPEPVPPVPSPVTQDETVPATQSSEPTKTATETARPAPKAPQRLQPFTLTVRVADDQASWLKITVDGKDAYEGTLAAGQSEEYEVTKSATVRIGKPEAVEVLRDGEPVDISNEGDVPTVTLKATEQER